MENWGDRTTRIKDALTKLCQEEGVTLTGSDDGSITLRDKASDQTALWMREDYDCEFRTLPQHPGYKFFADGRIRSKVGNWLSPAPAAGRQRYSRVSLPDAKSGEWKTQQIHVLICEAFHGPRPFPGAQVRHLDGNNRNNQADNLRWGTSAENHADQKRHGTRWDNRGEKHPLAKLTWEQVREIRERYAAGGITQRELGAEYSVSRERVGELVRGSGWSETRSYEPTVRQ